MAEEENNQIIKTSDAELLKKISNYAERIRDVHTAADKSIPEVVDKAASTEKSSRANVRELEERIGTVAHSLASTVGAIKELMEASYILPKEDFDYHYREVEYVPPKKKDLDDKEKSEEELRKSMAMQNATAIRDLEIKNGDFRKVGEQYAKSVIEELEKFDNIEEIIILPNNSQYQNVIKIVDLYFNKAITLAGIHTQIKGQVVAGKDQNTDNILHTPQNISQESNIGFFSRWLSTTQSRSPNGQSTVIKTVGSASKNNSQSKP